LDALLTTLVAAFLAEWGDKTQLLVIALAARFRRPRTVLAGVAVAAAANSALAAAGGAILHGFIMLRFLSLLVALALISAGAGGLFRNKTPDMGASWRAGAFLTTLGCFFLLEFGDKTQFLTVAFAAQYDQPILAAAGASVGIIAASAPAALLGNGLAEALPLRKIGFGVGILFVLIGLVVAVNALRLV